MDGHIRIGTKLDTKNFDSQIEYITNKMQEIQYKLKKADAGEEVGDTMKLEAQYEKLSNQLSKLILQKTKLSKQNINEVSGVNEVRGATDSVGRSIGEVIKKCTRWALSVIGIRSAYSAIRSAMATISQYDKQVAADLEYIKFALAMALKPIVEWMIKAIYKILSYVNMLSKTLFGVNLFKNSGVKDFQNALANSANSANKINKSLQRFDEANVLDDDSSGGINTPSYDLSVDGIEDIPVPEWLTWIKENWQTVVGAIGAIVIAYIAFKTLLETATGRKETMNPFSGFLDGLGKAALAIAILGGIGIVISQVTGLIKTFSESGMTLKDVAILLGIVLGELALAFTAIAMASKLMDWEGIVGAGVILAGFALIIHEVAELLTAFSESGLELNDVIGLMATILVSIVALMGSIALLGPLMTAGLGPFLVVVAGISAILAVMALTLPKILEACSEFISKSAPGISQILTVIGEQIQGIIGQLGETLPPIIDSVGNLFSKIFNGISNVTNSVGNVIVKILQNVKDLITTTLTSLLNFINRLGPAMDSFVTSAINSTTKLINFLISGIEYLVNTLIVSGINKIISAVNSISKYVGINIPQVQQQSIPRFVPRLARGAIVNNPGRGVPLSSVDAITGEAGHEGILPLDNPSTMSELGRTIAKYVNIELTSILNLEGRTLARVMRKFSADNQFATNS